MQFLVCWAEKKKNGKKYWSVSCHKVRVDSEQRYIIVHCVMMFIVC